MRKWFYFYASTFLWFVGLYSASTFLWIQYHKRVLAIEDKKSKNKS